MNTDTLTHVTNLNPSQRNDLGTHARPLLAFKHRTSPEPQLVANKCFMKQRLLIAGKQISNLTTVSRVLIRSIETIPTINIGIAAAKMRMKVKLPDTVAHRCFKDA